jgi:hypothetical protein
LICTVASESRGPSRPIETSLDVNTMPIISLTSNKKSASDALFNDYDTDHYGALHARLHRIAFPLGYSVRVEFRPPVVRSIPASTAGSERVNGVL